jgi:hypothetical protein
MYSQLHVNYVFYKDEPRPGNLYKQIVVVEKEKYELRIFEGEVLEEEPRFDVDNPDAEVYLHDDLKSALADAEKECEHSVEAGWIQHPAA